LGRNKAFLFFLSQSCSRSHNTIGTLIPRFFFSSKDPGPPPFLFFFPIRISSRLHDDKKLHFPRPQNRPLPPPPLSFLKLADYAPPRTRRPRLFLIHKNIPFPFFFSPFFWRISFPTADSAPLQNPGPACSFQRFFFPFLLAFLDKAFFLRKVGLSGNLFSLGGCPGAAKPWAFFSPPCWVVSVPSLLPCPKGRPRGSPPSREC